MTVFSRLRAGEQSHMMFRLASFIATLAVVTSVVGVTPSSSLQAASAQSEPIRLTWHSAGDSYSAGEGVSGNAGACAQSDRAFGPLASSRLPSERAVTDTHVFTACTGHLVEDFFNPRPGSDKASLADWAVEQGLASGRADVMTISFGGNDIGFADTVFDCLPLSDWVVGGIIGGCDESESDIRNRIDSLLDPSESCTGGRHKSRRDETFSWSCDLLIDDRGTSDPTDDLRGSIIDFYRLLVDQHLTDIGRLYVVGYPGLFAPIDEWRAWNAFGCQGVRRGDAEKLDRLSTHLDDKLREAVKRADDGQGRIVYVSRRSLFRDGGHELCGPGQDWLNGISNNRGPGIQWARYQTSFHPNAAGHDRTANAVLAHIVDDLGRMVDAAKPDEEVAPDRLREALDYFRSTKPICDAHSDRFGNSRLDPVRFDQAQATEQVDGNRVRILDGLGAELTVDFSTRPPTIYGSGGPLNELPIQYSFACPPELYPGTISE